MIYRIITLLYLMAIIHLNVKISTIIYIPRVTADGSNNMAV